MPLRSYLGEFEHLVLLALLRLEERAYGVSIRQEIQIHVKRDVSIGAVYATLDRLEQKAYVRSLQGDPTPERGGRAKRFFRITPKGLTAVKNTHRVLSSMTRDTDLSRSFS